MGENCRLILILMNKKILFLLPMLVTLGLTACGANDSIQADGRSVDETWRKTVTSSDILPPLIEVGASCSRILTNPVSAS